MKERHLEGRRRAGFERRSGKERRRDRQSVLVPLAPADGMSYLGQCVRTRLRNSIHKESPRRSGPASVTGPLILQQSHHEPLQVPAILTA